MTDKALVTGKESKLSETEDEEEMEVSLTFFMYNEMTNGKRVGRSLPSIGDDADDKINNVRNVWFHPF